MCIKKTDKTQSDTTVFDVPIGRIKMIAHNASITDIGFVTKAYTLRQPTTRFLRDARKQLINYFDGKSTRFKLKLELHGTDFQKRVWCHLQTIPFAKTETYGEIAQTLHTGARAVGNACRQNRCLLVVPCHRVVSPHGLGGFNGKRTGFHVSHKAWLLDHEKKHVRSL